MAKTNDNNSSVKKGTKKEAALKERRCRVPQTHPFLSAAAVPLLSGCAMIFPSARLPLHKF